MTGDTQTQAAADPRAIQTPEEFAGALTALREAGGLSVRQVSRGCGVPSATLGGYFSGRHLPNATQLPVLDAVLTALGVSDPAQHAEWHEALHRVRKARGKRTATVGAAPYRGLNAFTEDDAELFFGRETVVSELVQMVAATGESGWVFLVGPSGSGKSSVLRAGLAARLRTDRRVVVMVPGPDPERALLLALTAERPEVLIIDQAEEMFSRVVDPVSRQRFIAHLAELADTSSVVVLGLRADFYGQAASQPDLVQGLRESQMLLGAMTLSELRDAVTSPARTVGVTVADDMLDLLLRDLTSQRGEATSDAGALPLLSHALLSTWQRHTGAELTVSDYLAVGGLRGAVKQSAEAVYGSFDSVAQAAAQWLFTQLVLVDPDGAMTRRRVEHETLRHPDPATDNAVDTVIEAFVAGRLLTAQETTLEISHEALLTAWPRLHEWVLDDLDTARLQSRIAEAARVWDEHDRDPDLLWRGGPLADSLALAGAPATSSRILTGIDREFVEASAHREQLAERDERRRVSRLRTIVTITTVLAVVATSLAGLAFWLRTQADKSRDAAQSAQLAISADVLRARDPAAAAQLALAGYRIAPELAARSSLLNTTGVPTPVRFVGPVGEMHATTVPDGSLVAVSGKDGTTRLWQRDDAGGYQQLPDLPGFDLDEPGPIWASSFSPDGSLLVAADVTDAQSTLEVWNMSDPSNPVTVGTYPVDGAVQSMTFSPDGKQLLVGALETIHRWDVADQLTPRKPLSGFAGQVMGLSFAPDGARLAVGTDAGTLVILSGADLQRREPATVAGDVSSVTSVAFSPDGRALASAQKSGEVRLWRVGSRAVQAGAPFGDFESWVNDVTFDPAGELLAAASSDGHTKLFGVSDRAIVADFPVATAGTSVQFVDGGRGLLTSQVGGTAHLWSLPSPVVTGFGDSIWALGQDVDNTTMMVAPGAGDGRIHLYSMGEDGPVPLQVLSSEQAGPMDGSAGISGDGQWVAGGTGTGQVAVWQRRGDGFQPAGVVTAGEGIVQNVSVSQDGSLMVAVEDAGRLAVWSLRADQQPESLGSIDVGGLPLSAAINPAGDVVAVGLSDGSVRLWNVSGAGVTQAGRMTGFENYVYAVSFDPTGRFLAAGSTDQTVRIWDVSDPAAAQPVGDVLKGPVGAVYGLDWNTAGDRLAAASEDGTVWLWDTSEVERPGVVATLRGPGTDMLSVTFGAGDSLYAAGADQAVVGWETDVVALADQICTRTGSGLGREEWQRLMPSMEFVETC